MSDFTKRVLQTVESIPRGTVMTYAEVARRAGNPRAYRAVGSILRKNRDPNIPCHRVICSDGRLGKYNRGDAEKEKLLRREGYSF